MSRIRCSIRYFCLSTLLIFVGTILLCAFTITVVLPYQATRYWIPVVCHVTMESAFNRQQCSCAQQTMTHPTPDYDVIAPSLCASKFPCLQVYVVISDVTDSYVNENYTSSSPFLLYRSWTDLFYATCTLHECADEEWNIKESKRFQGRWGQIGNSYQCYLDADTDDYNGTKGSVILERTSDSQVLHAVLWPSLCLLIGLTMWLGLCLDCCTIELRQYPELPAVDRTFV